MTFDGPLVIEFDANASRQLGGDYWRVIKSFRYYPPANLIDPTVTAEQGTEWVFVSAGMLTDLGTIPKIFRAVFDEQGAGSQAFVVHDVLCDYLSVTVNGAPQSITRQTADLILLAALQDSGLSRPMAYSIYNAVALYQMVEQIKSPSITALKSQLEADFNYEAFQ